MKKIIAVTLCLLLLCSLAACGEEKPEEKADHMDWVWTGASGKRGALTDTGYYFLERTKNVLSYVDLNSGSKVVLCNKVGCLHGGLECEAYIANYQTSPLFFWNDHVYYVDEIHTGNLYRRDATGAKLMEIGTPAKKYIEEGKSCTLGGYVQAGEYMYYLATISSSGRDEDGANIKLKELKCIGRIHLNSGKDEILVEQAFDKNGSALLLCAAKEDGVLFAISEGVDLSPSDPGYSDAHKQSDVTLNTWSESTGEVTELLRKPKKELNEILLVENGKVYYATQSPEKNKRGDACVYDLNTGKDKTIYESATLYHYGGGIAMLKTSEDEHYRVCNLETGEVFPNELSHLPFMEAHSDLGIVISTYIMDEENPTSIKETIYCYVTYAALADGLQETDLVALYSVKSGYS